MGIRQFFARCIHNRIHRRIARKLELNDAQQARLTQLHEALRALRDEARSGWSYQREALRGLLGQERIDRAEALRLARVPMAMVDDALPRAVGQLADFCDTLDARQRARLADLIDSHGCRHHHCCAG
jgi:Spy/CpxP family protein refolding chaperone